MTQEVRSIREVENIKSSNFKLSIKGNSPWDENGRAQRLAQAVSGLMKKLIKKDGLFGCSVVRLIIFANDLNKEIEFWQKQLGDPTGVSSAQTVGKQLIWGNGEFETTYSIIILHEGIGLALIEGKEDIKNVATETIVHELAHVHDGFIMLKEFGFPEVPKYRDRNAVLQFIARSTWSEFFAEFVACRHTRARTAENIMDHWLSLLMKSLEEISASDEMTSRDHIKAVEKLSGVFCHIGRTIGALSGLDADSEDRMAEFAMKTELTAPRWGPVFTEAHKELNRLLAMEALSNEETFILTALVGRVIDDQGLQL